MRGRDDSLFTATCTRSRCAGSRAPIVVATAAHLLFDKALRVLCGLRFCAQGDHSGLHSFPLLGDALPRDLKLPRRLVAVGLLQFLEVLVFGQQGIFEMLLAAREPTQPRGVVGVFLVPHVVELPSQRLFQCFLSDETRQAFGLLALFLTLLLTPGFSLRLSQRAVTGSDRLLAGPHERRLAQSLGNIGIVLALPLCCFVEPPPRFGIHPLQMVVDVRQVFRNVAVLDRLVGLSCSAKRLKAQPKILAAAHMQALFGIQFMTEELALRRFLFAHTCGLLLYMAHPHLRLFELCCMRCLAFTTQALLNLFLAPLLFFKASLLRPVRLFVASLKRLHHAVALLGGSRVLNLLDENRRGALLLELFLVLLHLHQQCLPFSLQPKIVDDGRELPSTDLVHLVSAFLLCSSDGCLNTILLCLTV